MQLVRIGELNLPLLYRRELLANRKLKRMPDKASIRVRLVESQVADCVTMPRDCVYEFYQKRFLSDADAKVSFFSCRALVLAFHAALCP